MIIQRDWSQLSSELLEQIVERIVSISDFIRFRSVCKSWRSAALPNNLRRPQPPLLLLPCNANTPDRCIFSFATRRIHHLVLPQLTGKRILSSANGWMLLVDLETNALSLLNPISLAQIQLPPNNYFKDPIRYGHLFHDHSADSFMVFCHSTYCSKEMGFIKVGEDSWSVLANCMSIYLNFKYHRGKFFGYDVVTENIVTLDASLAHSNQPVFACSLRDIPGSLKYSKPFVSANGRLFLLSRDVNDPSFSSYELDFEGGKLTWSKVQFEDYSIFQAGLHSTMCCVKDFPHYNGNSVYTTVRLHNKDVSTIAVKLFNNKDGTESFIPSGWEWPEDINHGQLWFTPSLV